MAFEADRVVVEIIAKLDQFDTPVKRSTETFKKAMDEQSKAAEKTEKDVERSAKKKAKAEKEAADETQKSAEKKAKAEEDAARRSKKAAADTESASKKAADSSSKRAKVAETAAAAESAAAVKASSAHAGASAQVVRSEGLKATAATAAATQTQRAATVEAAAATQVATAKVAGTAQATRSDATRAASAAAAAASVQRSALAEVAAIQTRSAQIGQFSRLLGNQLNDVGALLSSARSPFVAPVREAPKVSKAFGLVQVAGAAMGGVLGGIVVQGAFALVDSLAQLILKSDSAEDQIKSLVEKLKEHAEKTRLSEEADRRWIGTLDGLIDRQRKLNEELGKRLKVQAATDLVDLRQAEGDRDKLQKALADEQQRLADLRARLAKAPRSGVGIGQGAGTTGVDTANLNRQIAEAERKIADIRRGLNDAVGRVTKGQIIIGETQGRALVDLTAKAQRWSDLQQAILRSIQQANPKLAQSSTQLSAAFSLLSKAVDSAAGAGVNFDATTKKSDALNVQLRAGQISAQKYASGINALAVALQKQADAAKEAAKANKENNRESGRQIGFDEARRIAEGAGFRVNSAQRSTARQAQLFNDPNVNRPGNPVARPRTSAHEGARGRWALDIQFAPGLTAGKIRKTFADQGVSLTALFKEKGHFHAEGSRSQAAAGEAAAERAARRAEAARIEDENERQAHQNEMAGLNAAEIEARQALITSAEDIAALEVQAIEISRQKYNDNLLHLQSIGKLNETEVAERTKVNDEIAKLRTELVERREEQRKFRMREAAIERQNAVQAGGLQAQQDLLRSQEGIARTQRERQEIGRRLVDLQYQEERLALQAAIAREARLRAEYARTKSQETLALLEQAEVDAAIARQRLGTIDQRQGAASQANAEANASPLQSYFGDIQAEADDINSAFERIAAGGLQNFTDRLTDAIVNFRSLGDVGRAVLAGITADLVRLAIRLILNATIGKIVQSGAAAAAAAGGSAVAAAWAPAAAAVSLATFGANAGPASAAIIGTNALAMGFAQAGGGGGFRSGGYTGDIPENKVAGAVHGREFVFDAPATRRIGVDNLEAIRSGRIRPSNAEARRPGGAAADLSGMRSLISEAVAAGISAMPDVHNFIGFDPDALVAKALGSQATVNRLIEVLGQNSTKAKAALN